MIKILITNFKKWLNEPNIYEKKRNERLDTLWFIQNQAQRIMDESDDKHIKKLAFRIKYNCGKLY